VDFVSFVTEVMRPNGTKSQYVCMYILFRVIFADCLNLRHGTVTCSRVGATVHVQCIGGVTYAESSCLRAICCIHM
jgi:hypothetical protein